MKTYCCTLVQGILHVLTSFCQFSHFFSLFPRHVRNFKGVDTAKVSFHDGLIVLSVTCDKLMTCHHNTVYRSMLKIMFVVNTEYLIIPGS